MFFRLIGKTRWPPWPLIGWDIFDLSSETTERNSKKLDRKQDLKALYQVCVFRADRKNKMATLASDLWLAEIFSTSRDIFDFSVETTEPNSTKFDRKQDLKALYQVCVFRADRKNKMAAWPLIGWDIFDFSVETAERNSTNLDRKQDLNALYHVCVFWADRKNKMAAWPLIGWDIFDFFSETTEWNSTKLDRKQDLNALYQVCVFWADRKNKMATLVLIGRDIFDFSSETAEPISMKLNRKQDLNALPSLCFLGRSEKQNGRPGLWLAETFSTSALKPLNGIQQNLTGSKLSMPSTRFVFFRQIRKKQNGRPGLWLA